MRHVLHRTPPTLPGLAAIAVFATCGTASAQALFTTLNSAKVTLNSLNGTPTSSYWTYTGPSNNTGGLVSMTSFAQPNTGSAEIAVFNNILGMNWAIEGVPTTWSVRFEWDVTFSSALGGVLLAYNPGNIFGTWTVKPLGGSEAGFWVGDVLANGQYTIAWEYAELADSTIADAILVFGQSSAGGGAVPLPGAAGLAAIGLVGLSRRRRR
jgi:hypothetical protein